MAKNSFYTRQHVAWDELEFNYILFIHLADIFSQNALEAEANPSLKLSG